MTSSSKNKQNIVFFCSHHSGHINPILSLVRQFLKHGDYSVYFFGDPTSKNKIEKVGAKFEPIGDANVHEACMSTIKDRFGLEPSPDVAGLFFPLEILPASVHYLDPNGKLVDRVKALAPKAIVSDVSALWGVLVSKILKVPLITSCSCTLFESLEPPFGHFRRIDSLKKSTEWIEETYGIQYDPMESYMNESDFTIAFSSPEFQPPSRRCSNNVRLFGPAMDLDYDAFLGAEQAKDLASPDSLLKWFEEGKRKHPNRKVVYCSLGTVVGQEPWTIMERNKNDEDMVSCFYQRVFDVMRKKGAEEVQCIISIGNHRKVEDIPAQVPDNVICLPRVPQVLVLDKADAFITHCGNNGVHEAFFTACPMVCIPVFGDQHPNAQTICDIHAGVQIASPFVPLPSPNLDHATAERISKALDEVTQRKDIKAGVERISESMKRRHSEYVANGYEQMVNFINSGSS